jgi:hypothetical protein
MIFCSSAQFSRDVRANEVDAGVAVVRIPRHRRPFAVILAALFIALAGVQGTPVPAGW